MHLGHEDRFVLYVRADHRQDESPEDIEQPLLVCSSYAEARYLQRVIRNCSRDCVIRFLGPTGGGD